MAVAVKMPQLGETVVEGTVARWLKSPGDAIDRLEPLLEISTDKIDTEVPAPAAGTLLQVLVQEGQTVRAGETLAYIGDAGDAPDTQAGTSAAPEQPAQVAATAASANVPATAATSSPPRRDANGDAGPARSRPAKAAGKPAGRDFISPVVANMAREHAIDLDAVDGTGMGGRITKKDVLAYLAQRAEQTATPATVTDSAHAEADLRADGAATDAQTPAPVTDDETWEPLSTMRRLIAEHMVASKRTSPHVTSIFEVDMTAVVRHREASKATFQARGLQLTYTAYFVAAAAQALHHVPQVNARFHDQDGQRGIIHNRRVHIGIAVAVEGGLVVPVIRDADERNLAGLARAVRELAQAAQARQLAPDAAQGGTFTITNHGTGGSLLGTPVINQPQGAILGVGAIAKRPVVRSANGSLLPSADDAIVIRPMCYLSLTFDHRLIDGATADAFLTRVKHVLEDWQQTNQNTESIG